MKLYEFTITDNRRLNDNEILRQAEEIMRVEAETNEWTDCVLQRIGTPEQIVDGGHRYHFAVLSEAGENIDGVEASPLDADDSIRGIAASPRLEN